MHLFLNFPTGQILNGSYILQEGSYVRITSYPLLSPDATLVAPARIVDLEAPKVFNCPANQTFSASSLDDKAHVNVSWTDPTATDNRRVQSITSNAPPDHIFTLGTTQVTFLVRDDYGNINSSCQFRVNVIDDVPPIIHCPANSSYNLSASSPTVTVPSAALTPLAATYEDNSGSSIYTLLPLTRSLDFPFGSHLVTRTVMDASGNAYSCNSNIHIQDFFPPEFSKNPVTGKCASDIAVVSNDGVGAITQWAIPVATDNSGNVSVSEPPFTPFVTLFPVGVTQVSYVATDPSGNSATCSFSVRVSSIAASSSSANNTSSIYGGAIGGAVGGLILLVMVILWLRARNANKKRPHNFEQMIAALADIKSDGERRVPREIRRPHVRILEVCVVIRHLFS